MSDDENGKQWGLKGWSAEIMEDVLGVKKHLE